MKKTLLTSVLIVAIGAMAGAIANATWYGEPWVRPPKKVSEALKIDVSAPEAKSADFAANVEGTGKPVEVANGGDPAPSPNGTDTAATNPCEPDPEKPNVVGLDCVLHFLRNGGAFIIDAREQHDFDEGHLKSAIHVPSSDIFANIPERVIGAGIATSDIIIVYCGGGQCEASHNVADALRDQFGYERVYVYEKGWEEIESSGKFGDYVSTGGSNG